MNAPVVYLVRFRVKPGSEKKVLDWLDKGHIEEVVREPGFLWSRRYRLLNPADDGWTPYAMIYGVESEAALKTYFDSEASKRFVRERSELGLDDLLRIERDWGQLETAVEA